MLGFGGFYSPATVISPVRMCAHTLRTERRVYISGKHSIPE